VPLSVEVTRDVHDADHMTIIASDGSFDAVDAFLKEKLP
jgi:hypothetical protein